MADGIVEYVLRLKDQTKQGTASAVTGSKRLEDQTEKTTRAVDDLGDEAVQTSKQLDRMGKESTSAARAQSGLARGLSGAVTGAGRLLSSVRGLTAAIGAAGLAGATTAAVVSFRAAAQEVADLRNDIADASTRSGIATDTLQGLRLAAEGAGLQFSALTSGLDQFGRRVSDAARGGNATAEAFAELGVSVTDANGDIRDGDAVLRETLAALNAMEPSAQRSALAVETLGRAGGKLLQALSGTGLDAFVEQARIFGVDIGPKAAASAGEWQRATAELALVFRGLKGALVDTFGGGADLVFGFTDAVVFLSTKIGTFAAGAPAILGAVEAAFSSLGDVISAQLDRVSARVEALGIVLEALTSGIGFTGALDAAGRRISQADAAFGDAARARDAAIDRVGAVSGAVSAGAQATAVDRLVSLRQTRESIRAGGRQGQGPGGGGGQDSDPEAIATEAAVAASRVFASGYTEDRRRLSDVLTVGEANIAEQQAQTAAEAQRIRDEGLQGAQAAIGVTGQALSGDLGGALSSAGGAAGLAGLGVAGAAVSGLQFIGEQGAQGVSDTLDGLKAALLGALEALPELIGDVLPRFAISLVGELIPALIKAAPEILISLITDLPVAIAKALASIILPGNADSEVSTGMRLLQVVTGETDLATNLGLEFLASQDSGRSSRSSNAARTATDGQTATARESDRLAQVSIRPRRRRQTVRANPFDTLARQYDAQYGTLGRASSTTIGAT